MRSEKSVEPLIVIPARFESARLPGKPLIPLNGVPMIIRTWRQAVKAVGADRVLVATEHERIAEVCRQYEARVVMTSSTCLTGTDRVAEVARSIPASCYVNVQGDEPAFNPEDIVRLVDAAERDPAAVINGYCSVSDEDQFRSPTIPKVVIRPDGRLLYMSRAAIPTDKSLGFRGARRQVCAYAFPPSALEAFSARATKTPLESVEDIEILRFLELGFEVRMIEMSNQSVSVDVPEDVAHAEARLSSLGLA
ncbi:3-deoxy-manno-octulosonate cytidylyltransferase [Pseudoxanthomonas sp. Root630]|uniref:3-deoxy-manno-octulosonate cytidylyltransferase n=1 Tax=Pseudoxanthomonas sp. Root630 TaxID=1736574 RepID=UPI0007036DB0|nr:3-deoxy-manno-octulosonate cytidylyltransferase [Pseudoxanthomonas sp. Root630]KRA46878.1 3-deoxy-manno-octulosonate cytidylyltransferase [Pseudoxanthomonas sp. Root630]